MITISTVDLHFLKSFNSKDLQEVKYPIFTAKYINGGGVVWEAMNYFSYIAGNPKNPFNKLSKSTFVNYSYDMNVWIDFVDLKIANKQWDGDDLWSATDYTLEEYVEHLKETPTEHGIPRSNNSIRKLVLRVVYFYKTCTNLKIAPISMCGDEDDKDKTYNINYTWTESDNIYAKGRKQVTNSLHHYTMPRKEPGRGREPMSDDEIAVWSDAINATTNNPLLIKRWEHIEILLEFTGGRVSEIASVKASEILETTNISKSGIILTTTKGGNKGQKRTLDIPKAEFDVLYNYAKYGRPKLIQQAIKNGKIKEDHDHLIIKADGSPMTSRAITSHIGNVLRKVNAKRIHAHKFRHRFITINLASEIEKAMAGNRFNDQTYSLAIKELKKLTLHASRSAIEEYISLAFLYLNKNSNKNKSSEKPMQEFGELCLELLSHKASDEKESSDYKKAVKEVRDEVVELLKTHGIRVN